jgi:hypothetical protein
LITEHQRLDLPKLFLLSLRVSAARQTTNEKRAAEDAKEKKMQAEHEQHIKDMEALRKKHEAEREAARVQREADKKRAEKAAEACTNSKVPVVRFGSCTIIFVDVVNYPKRTA